MIRRPALLTAIVAVLLLAGCATVPTGGPVETAPPRAQQNDPGFVFTPNKPADGATPENIVRGFIQAASAGRGYGVAKEFLTADFAAKWQPDQRVLVHTASWTTAVRADDRIELTVPTSAEVDGTGAYTPSTRVVPLDFRLTRVRGQWRIADGPNGVVLAQPAFLRVFKPALLQFFDADYKRLVPDRRWFPVRQGGQVPDTVRALIAGQTPVLAQVTRSAFPPSTKLASPVRTSGGQVTVDLTATGVQPDGTATDRMQQQLADSLTVATSAVRLTMNGRIAPVAPQAEPQQLSATDPVVVSGGRLGAFTAAGTVQEDRELGPEVVGLRPSAVTVSAGQRLAAVLAGDGRVAVVAAGARPRIVDDRRMLLAPTLDQAGWTWSVPRSDPTGLRATDKSGRVAPLTADLGGTEVIAIEVSPDGTRLLVVVGSTSGSVAYVAGIRRDAKGVPIGLTSNQYPVLTTDGSVLDATWAGPSSVALLTASGSVQSVSVQQLGGIATVLGPPLQGAVQIVGVTGPDDLRVLLGSGALERRAPNGWTLEVSASIGVVALAVQR